MTTFYFFTVAIFDKTRKGCKNEKQTERNVEK